MRSVLTVAILSIGAWAGADTFLTTVTLSKPEKTVKVSPLIYGQYLEHVEEHEDVIYPVIWDNQSSKSNSIGLRMDTIDAVKQLAPPIVRWPGGCFADVYHWEDAIGPHAKRQPKPNLHWGGTESNNFGTDEFLHFCQATGMEPYINVNLGSGTLDEALRWLEYCNGTTATAQGRRRAENGRVEPYNVTYWGIGNETWGPWEMGHTDANTYSTSLTLWSKAMKQQDPSIKTLGVGSEEGNDHDWDRTVLQNAGHAIDLFTIHMYGITTVDSPEQYLQLAFTADYFDDRLKRIAKMIDENTTNSVKISIDEWNIRHNENGQHNRKSPRTMQDALFSAGFLNAMIRQSEYVKMANYVFLINGNGTLLIRDGDVVWTPLAYLFQAYTRSMTGEIAEVSVNGPGVIPPRIQTAVPGRPVPDDYQPGERPWVDIAAVQNEAGGFIVSIVNRNPDHDAEIILRDNMGRPLEPKRLWKLAGETVLAQNDFNNLHAVTPLEKVLPAGNANYISPAGSVSLLWCE